VRVRALLDTPDGYGSQPSPFKEKPMAQLVVLYKTPKSADAFDNYYFATHVPLAKKLPGLKKYDVSKGTVASPAGASGVHLVATLYFDSLDAIKAAFGSAEGKATAGDLANFADGGADLYFFDTKEV
jgi:uncharacterized protein (TIGR02118 family)